MDENKMNEDQALFANYAIISESKDLLAITRNLAINLTKTEYLSVEDFLLNLSDSDLHQLIEIIDFGSDHKNYSDLMLLSIMLANAEGSDTPLSLNEYTTNANSLVSFLICESLFRKGLVKIYRKNMSFDKDMGELKIVEKLDENHRTH